MESYKYSFEYKKYIGEYDKRLSIPFYIITIKPYLYNLRKYIIENKLGNAFTSIYKRIFELRKAFNLINPNYNDFFYNLSYHIIEFLRSDMTNSYIFYKNMLENDYKIIMKNLIQCNNINLNDSIAEYIFNVFFDIEKFVSNDIFNMFEINYVLLKLDFINF